jgi:uncharacterized protein (DUF1501 family)
MVQKIVSSRRSFLKMVSVGTCGAACHSVLAPFGGNVAYAAGGAPGPIKYFIEIFFYGGYCSQGFFPVHNNGFRSRYPTLWVSPDNAASVGRSDISMHVAFRPFVAEATPSKIALVYNVGHPTLFSRSHEIAQDANERIDYNVNLENGLGVGAAIAQATGSPYSLISFGGNSDFSMGGSIPARSVGSLAQGKANFWQSDWFNLIEQNIRAGAPAPASAEQAQLQVSIDSMNTGLATLQDISRRNPPIAFPNSGIGNNLADITRLISAGVGTAFFVPYGGFDTHSNQAQSHTNSFTTLNAALVALVRNLKAIQDPSGGTAWDRTVILTRTDFGRTFENQARGTDHGHCNTQMVVGGRVIGGVYGDVMTEAQIQNVREDYLNGQYVQFSAMQPTKEIVGAMGLSVPFPQYPGNIRVPLGLISA